MTERVTLRAARPSELGAMRSLLEAAELPAGDLTAGHLEAFRVAVVPVGHLVGGVGLELAGDAALLRSLVVAPQARGTGLGHALVDAALELARERGVSEVWLLTTTAERFFERLGWRRAERASAPAGIRATAEFSALCPASSVCMVRDLQGSRREVPV